MKVELKSCSLSAATAYSLRVQCCQSEIQSATSVSSLSIRCCQLSVGDNRVQILAVYILLLIFLCWHYNPLWVLAFLVIFFHSALSILSFLHPLIPIIWMSSSTSSIRLFLDLPLILLPIGFHSNILLGVLPPSIHITCPSQAIFGSIYIYIYMSVKHYVCKICWTSTLRPNQNPTHKHWLTWSLELSWYALRTYW